MSLVASRPLSFRAQGHPMSITSASRRQVRYASFDDLLAEADAAAARNASTTGKWSLGQIFEHVAIAMDRTLDGFGFTAPWPVRVIARNFLKRRILLNGMPAGFQLRGKGAEILVPGETNVEAGLEHLRRSIARMKSETQRAPHPAFGSMSLDESNLFQLRHAELHMSFVAPAPGTFAQA
jgi:hypothetical protein